MAEIDGGTDAILAAQQAARESLAARLQPKTLTDRYISEQEYVDLYDTVAREVCTCFLPPAIKRLLWLCFFYAL